MDVHPLEAILPSVIADLEARNTAREAALATCRAIIRRSALAIRAVHRGDFAAARATLGEARAAHANLIINLAAQPEVHHAGFVHDAEKELAEAAVTYALAGGEALPTPAQVGVGQAAYLNGLAEATGELRRMLLDRLRRGVYDGCEDILQTMEDIYSALVVIDYPDAITGNLRRTTDQTRGILERTRGDLTMAAMQLRIAPPRDREADPIPDA